ncbi:hypothetical protein LZG04_28295 [Saccharothrix sp. S26]|uniref:hypothetical protein n=1 Tax=Saccharothrix sp. S26 TaxID=2907215 RepID=UPI001F365B48|nr:hypothetical protein [Saccharothrix sp. S26]MCE6998667.1 hypothetical protein [Saccharothrix sp. S26]
MVDVEQRKRPGVALAGFAVPFALQVAVVAAYQGRYLWDAGWRGGQYAYAFIGVAVGSIVLGCVLKFFRPPWRSVGTGLLLAGTFGFVAVFAVLALFLVAFSQWSPT